MKQIRIVLLTLVAAILVGCGTSSTVPITGRKRTLLVSDEQVLSLSNEQYTQYMKSAKPSTNATNTAMVKRVGQNLANAVVAYLNANGLSSEVAQYQWEFNLVQDQQVNAFCMPGGKIVVYEGLLPVTQDETSLAIVLGHEIAHAVAKHSAEQMSMSAMAYNRLPVPSSDWVPKEPAPSIRVTMRVRPIIWVSSLPLWPAIIQRQLSVSGNVCRRLRVVVRHRG